MKIGLICQPNYRFEKNAQGGAKFFIYQYLKALDKRNDIKIIAFISKKAQIDLQNTKILKKYDRDFPILRGDISRDDEIKVKLTEYIFFYKNILLNYQDQVDLFHILIGGSGRFELWMPIITCLANLIKKPIIITLHTSSPFYSLGIEKELNSLISKNVYFNSISKFQQKIMPLKFIKNIYNGVDLDNFIYNEKPDNSFLWIGRINQDKALHLACRLAKKANIKLNIAGNINLLNKKSKNTKYFLSKVKPLLSKKIKYIGFLGLEEKIKYYQGARAMIFTSSFQGEGCPLVILESCACGTPVIVFKNLAGKELIKDGVNGFFVETEKEFIKAIENVDKINRRRCRKYMENNFSFRKMIDNYIKLYKKIYKK